MADWWEYPTNYSNGNSVSGPSGMFFNFPNYILSDKFGIGLVIIVWIMSFTLSMVAGSRKAIAVASWISFVFSIYFAQMGGMNLILSIALAFIAVITTVFSRNEGANIG